MPTTNPYLEQKDHRMPLAPTRAVFSQPDDVQSKKETKWQYREFVCSSGPPDPCDYENKNVEDDVFSVPTSVNLLTDDSINLEKKPAAKPIARASARQQDSGDEAILAASLGSEGRYICNDCGNSPCDWVRHGPAVREYHQLQLDLYGPEEFMPPPNVQRHRLYRQMALHLGFVRREKHAICVLEGVRQIVPSPTEDYMGHRDVWRNNTWASMMSECQDYKKLTSYKFICTYTSLR